MWRTSGIWRAQATRNMWQRAYSSKAKESGMKKLVKEYGWTATGVYVALSFIDLPITFGVVHSVGQKRLEDLEIKIRHSAGVNEERDNTYIHKAAEGGKSLFWTELAIAYVIHKVALVFVRVPLTVAITPSIANKLSQWGFKIKKAVPTVDKAKLASHIEKAQKEIGLKPQAKIGGNVRNDISGSKQISNGVHSAAPDTSKSPNNLKEKAKHNFGEKPNERRKRYRFF